MSKHSIEQAEHPLERKNREGENRMSMPATLPKPAKWQRAILKARTWDGYHEWPGHVTDAMPGVAILRAPVSKEWRVTHIESGCYIALCGPKRRLEDVKRLALQHLTGIDWTQPMDQIKRDSAAIDAANNLMRALRI